MYQFCINLTFSLQTELFRKIIKMKFVFAFALVLAASAVAVNGALPADFPNPIPVDDAGLLRSIQANSGQIITKFQQQLAAPGEFSTIVEAARKANANGDYGYAARFRVFKSNPKIKAFCTLTLISTAPLPPPKTAKAFSAGMGISCEQSTEM